MRTLVTLVALMLSTPSWGAQEPCTTQDYADPKKVPNWRCPGPDEGIMVPEIRFNPSLGVPVGSTVHIKDAKQPSLTTFDTVLMDRAKVTQLGLRIQGLRRLRWLERHRADEVLKIEKKYMSDRLTAQLNLEKSRVKVAVGQRDQARKERDRARAWYRSWTCGLVVGIVITAGTTVAIVYTAR
jgi:hypothetical protein